MTLVTIDTDWPRMGILLSGFRTDSELLEPGHERWLRQNIFPILRTVRVEVLFVGGASRIGDPDWNAQLSEARMQVVARFLDTAPPVAVYSPGDAQHWNPRGEQDARGGERADRARDRAVAVGLWPLGISPNPDARALAGAARSQARASFLTEVRRVISERRIQPGLSGEQREAEWGPLRERLLGFGYRLRSILRTFPPDHRNPGPELSDPITAQARTTVSSRRQQAYQTGERGALRIWNSLSADARWSLKTDEVTHDLLKDLCREFKRAFERYAAGTRSRWPVGGCEFYTEAEERRDPV